MNAWLSLPFPFEPTPNKIHSTKANGGGPGQNTKDVRPKKLWACFWINYQMFIWVRLKIKQEGYAGFGPCFHLAGFQFGTGFLSLSHIGWMKCKHTPGGQGDVQAPSYYMKGVLWETPAQG